MPIFVLWLGSGTIQAILTAMTTCLFLTVVNVPTGLAAAEPEMEDVLKALGAKTCPMEPRAAAGNSLLRVPENSRDARLRRNGPVRGSRLQLV